MPPHLSHDIQQTQARFERISEAIRQRLPLIRNEGLARALSSEIAEAMDYLEQNRPRPTSAPITGAIRA